MVLLRGALAASGRTSPAANKGLKKHVALQCTKAQAGSLEMDSWSQILRPLNARLRPPSAANAGLAALASLTCFRASRQVSFAPQAEMWPEKVSPPRGPLGREQVIPRTRRDHRLRATCWSQTVLSASWRVPAGKGAAAARCRARLPAHTVPVCTQGGGSRVRKGSVSLGLSCREFSVTVLLVVNGHRTTDSGYT